MSFILQSLNDILKNGDKLDVVRMYSLHAAKTNTLNARTQGHHIHDSRNLFVISDMSIWIMAKHR